jgi:hypothetical protein
MSEDREQMSGNGRQPKGAGIRSQKTDARGLMKGAGIKIVMIDT